MRGKSISLFFIEPAWSLYGSVCVKYVRALSTSCVVISADLTGRYSLISASIRWQSFHRQPSAYNIAYYTKCQLFGDLNHVTVSRQRPESDCFVILAAHVIGTQHQRATLRPTQRESVTRETKVSVLCRHIFNSQDQSWKGKQGPQTNILCFRENKPAFVGWLWALMSLSWFSLSVTSGPTISQMASFLFLLGSCATQTLCLPELHSTTLWFVLNCLSGVIIWGRRERGWDT